MKNLTERIDYAVKKAAAQALMEHKHAGRSIYILDNGKVVEVTADKIKVPQIPQTPKKA